MRAKSRSGWQPLVFVVSSILLAAIPIAAYGFIAGPSIHGAKVDWYILLCFVSFGTVPFIVAGIVSLVTSTIFELLTGLVRHNEVVDQDRLEFDFLR